MQMVEEILMNCLLRIINPSSSAKIQQYIQGRSDNKNYTCPAMNQGGIGGATEYIGYASDIPIKTDSGKPQNNKG